MTSPRHNCSWNVANWFFRFCCYQILLTVISDILQVHKLHIQKKTSDDLLSRNQSLYYASIKELILCIHPRLLWRDQLKVCFYLLSSEVRRILDTQESRGIINRKPTPASIQVLSYIKLLSLSVGEPTMQHVSPWKRWIECFQFDTASMAHVLKCQKHNNQNSMLPLPCNTLGVHRRAVEPHHVKQAN